MQDPAVQRALQISARVFHWPHLNKDSALVGAGLCIIDEVSMVNQEMGDDLLSFGVPILVLGNTARLPPINGYGFFTCRGALIFN